MDLTQIALLTVGALLGLRFFFFLVPFPLWMSARLSGVSVRLFDLVVMRCFRRIPPHQIIIPAITAHYADIPLSIKLLQTHHMSGGDVTKVVAALVAASKAKLELSWDTASCIDLAGRDILEAVQMSVNPRVLRTTPIEGVSQDGIEVRVVCLITVRSNIAQLVGSAGAETVLARVGEGIVTAIGSSACFRSVLENPNVITQGVLQTKLDAGTAYKILSIDIADIEVGENIGARLQIDQAEADKLVAQAKAEERLSEARATQVEMRALMEQMQCKVVESRAEVPEAFFEALSNGNLSVMEFYKMENLQADTSLRNAAADCRSFRTSPQLVWHSLVGTCQDPRPGQPKGRVLMTKPNTYFIEVSGAGIPEVDGLFVPSTAPPQKSESGTMSSPGYWNGKMAWDRADGKSERSPALSYSNSYKSWRICRLDGHLAYHVDCDDEMPPTDQPWGVYKMGVEPAPKVVIHESDPRNV